MAHLLVFLNVSRCLWHLEYILIWVNVIWYHFSPSGACTLAAVEGVWTQAPVCVRGVLSPPVTNDGARNVLLTQSSTLGELHCENLYLGHRTLKQTGKQGWAGILPRPDMPSASWRNGWIKSRGAGMMAGAWVQTKRPPPTRVARSHDTGQNNFCMKPVHRSFRPLHHLKETP